MKRYLLMGLTLLVPFVSMQISATEPSPKFRVSDEPQAVLTQDWAVRLPNETNIVYRGVLGTDSGGGSTASMLYPAPNAVGLLAALLTHGLLVGNSRRMEANRLQGAADKVLDPYRGIIGDFHHEELLQLALAQKRASGITRIALTGEAPGEEWFFVAEPTFSMTQDQKALIFDSAFIVYAPNSPALPAYQNALRVVSSPITAGDPLVYWSEESGRNLKHVSAQLMAMALELAATEIAKGAREEVEAATSNQKTMRYLEGATEKIERAELLQVTCDRAVLKTLRGGLMWVPLKQPHAYAVSPTSPLLECGSTEKK